ncbi:hypothetical protein PTKIN_Ptkin17bG0089300 [Pterospermum kingtungense]
MAVFGFPQCHSYNWSWYPRFPLGHVRAWMMVEMHEMVLGKGFDGYHELGQYTFAKNFGLYIMVPQQLIIEVCRRVVYMIIGGKSLKKFHDTHLQYLQTENDDLFHHDFSGLSDSCHGLEVYSMPVFDIMELMSDGAGMKRE